MGWGCARLSGGWQRCAGVGAENEEEHSRRCASSGSMVRRRRLPSDEHPAGRHLQFAKCEAAGAPYAEPEGGRCAGQSLFPPPPQGFASQPSPYLRRRRASILQPAGTAYPPQAMALFTTSLRLPQCASCVRRITHQNIDVWGAQQTRSISKRAKEAERNIVVKLLRDVPRYGRAGRSIYTFMKLF